MTSNITDIKESTKSFEKFTPIITVFIIVTSTLLFVGSYFSSLSEDVIFYYLAPTPLDILLGKYWGLITNNFIHVNIIHLVFNFFWIWFFGKKIEFESGKLFFTFLVISAAIISSVSEIFLSDSTGVGLSGIAYALFGYILVKSRSTESYKRYLNIKINVLFFAWLIFCIALTYFDIWNIANGGHIGGLIWGLIIGFISRYRDVKKVVLGTIVFILFISSIFWNPNSVTWLSYNAYNQYGNNEFDEAIVTFKLILEKDPENEFAKKNLEQLIIYQLQEKAYNLHVSKNYEKAIEVYEEILSIDENNEWAKENLQRIQKR
jgi:GlpG protein